MNSPLITKTVEEVIEVLIDYRGKTPPKSSEGIRLITAKVIKDGFIQTDNNEYVAESTYNTWMRRGLPQKGDVVITTEAPLGEVAELRSDEKVALAQRVILLRSNPSIMDQQYLYHALKSPFVQAGLMSRATGTTVFGIKQSELRQVQLPYFPIETQRKIAAILSAYDDLIENNTRRIKIMEEMAQSIYREWFVTFHFPGYEKARMVDTKLGNIPQGWHPRVLGDIARDIRRNVQPSAVTGDTPYFGLEHLPRKSIALSNWGTASEVQSTKLLISSGDILFGKIRPYFHKVGVSPVAGVCSSDIIVVAPLEPEYFGIVLECVSSSDFVDHATQTSQGTKMPRANWDILIKYPLVLPSENILKEFNSIITDIVNLINVLIFKNINLRNTRDLLLPRLISGELDVSELDISIDIVTAGGS